jgi:hypothetical protein
MFPECSLIQVSRVNGRKFEVTVVNVTIWQRTG